MSGEKEQTLAEKHIEYDKLTEIVNEDMRKKLEAVRDGLGGKPGSTEIIGPSGKMVVNFFSDTTDLEVVQGNFHVKISGTETTWAEKVEIFKDIVKCLRQGDQFENKASEQPHVQYG